MHDTWEILCSMWHFEIKQIEHCNDDNNYNHDNVIHVSVWFDFVGGLINVKIRDIWGRDIDWGHPFPRALGYKRRSDINEVDIMKFVV